MIYLCCFTLESGDPAVVGVRSDWRVQKLILLDRTTRPGGEYGEIGVQGLCVLTLSTFVSDPIATPPPPERDQEPNVLRPVRAHSGKEPPQMARPLRPILATKAPPPSAAGICWYLAALLDAGGLGLRCVSRRRPVSIIIIGPLLPAPQRPLPRAHTTRHYPPLPTHVRVFGTVHHMCNLLPSGSL